MIVGRQSSWEWRLEATDSRRLYRTLTLTSVALECKWMAASFAQEISHLDHPQRAYRIIYKLMDLGLGGGGVMANHFILPNNPAQQWNCYAAIPITFLRPKVIDFSANANRKRSRQGSVLFVHKISGTNPAEQERLRWDIQWSWTRNPWQFSSNRWNRFVQNSWNQNMHFSMKKNVIYLQQKFRRLSLP